jgi:hypothetical protein
LDIQNMKNVNCPKCGHQAPVDAICPNRGTAAMNGGGRKMKSIGQKPPAPPEAANWVIEKVPPEMIEEALGPFNLEKFMAEVREIEETGGHQLDDFIGEIEKIVKRRD